MAINVIIDSVTYSIPELGERSWGQDTTDLLEVLGNAAYKIKGGSIPLATEADFGLTAGLKALWYKTQTTNPASAGVVRLANLDAINWRDFANAGDLTLTVDASDKLTFDGSEVLDTDNTATVTNKTIDADNNTITNLAHGAEVDDPSSGVHGVTGSVVGTTDAQTLANKTIDNTNTVTVKDTSLTIQDDSDTTKQAKFQASGITTATTRTYTFQDADGTIAHEEDLVTAEGESADIRTTQGTAFGATDLGTFTGTTISDAATVKSALQELETQVETTDADLTSHTGDATIHFTEASIDHANITNVGTNTHAQIDTHISATGAHGVTEVMGTSGSTLQNVTYLTTDKSDNTDDFELAPSSVITRLTGFTADRAMISINPISTKVLILANDTAYKLTVKNEDTGATAANRILTGTGRDLSVAAGASISLVYDSTESRWRVVGGAGSGGLSTQGVSSATTAEVSLHYLVDTSGGAFTITLPAGSEGSVMRFTDATESWGTEPLTIAPATGEAIDGQAANETLVLDVTGTWVQFMWDNSAGQWVTDDIFAAYGDVSVSGSSGKNYVLNPDAATNTDDVTGDSGFSVTRTTTAAELAEESKGSAFLISGSGLTAGTSKVAWGITATGIDDADGGYMGRATCKVLDVSGSINGEYEIQVYNVTDSVYVGDEETITGTGTYILSVPLIAGNDYEFHLRAATGSTTWTNIGISGVTIEAVSQTWGSLGGWKSYDDSSVSVTGTNFTYDTGLFTPYKDPVTNKWFLWFSIEGSRSGSTVGGGINIAGITWDSNFTAQSLNLGSDTHATSMVSAITNSTNGISYTFSGSITSPSFYLQGNLALDSKPTWADWDNTAPTISDVQYENARISLQAPSKSVTASTDIDFDTEETVKGGLTHDSAGVVTIPTDGDYFVSATMEATSSISGTLLYISTSTNSVELRGPESSGQRVSVSGVIPLSAGDTVSIQSSGSFTSTGTARYNRFSVTRVSDFSARSVSMPFPNGTLRLDTGNGLGGSSSGDTRIRNFSNITSQTGDAFTYTTRTSTTGDYITMNRDMVVSISYSDARVGGASVFGISLNTSNTSADIYSIAASERLVMSYSSDANYYYSASITIKVSKGDIIRAHGDSLLDTTSDRTQFTIQEVYRLGN